jgi:phosphatidylserine decarboxylase
MLPQLGMKENALGLILKLVPKNILSYVVGQLVHLKLPRPLRQWSIAWFAKRYRIDLAEAEFNVDAYPSIGALFTRRLKPGLRPISSGVIHPVDGQLTQQGRIKNGTLIQAKGRDYSVAEFLADETAPVIFEGGHYLTYYLCPTDYHRVHSPLEAQIEKVTYLPGYLWPVNNWSVSSIDKLFSINERVVFWMNSPRGRAALVMVGATNVGRITLAFDQDMISNAALWGVRKNDKIYRPTIKVKAGDELGTFNMGSTVIVLYEKGLLDDSVAPLSGPVLLGQSVGKIHVH